MPATPFQRDKTLKGHYSVLYFSFVFHTVIIYKNTALYDVKSGEIEIALQVKMLFKANPFAAKAQFVYSMVQPSVHKRMTSS